MLAYASKPRLLGVEDLERQVAQVLASRGELGHHLAHQRHVHRPRQINDCLLVLVEKLAQLGDDLAVYIVPGHAAAHVALLEQGDPAPEDVEAPINVGRGDRFVAGRIAAEGGDETRQLGLALRGIPEDALLARLPEALEVSLLRQHAEDDERDQPDQSRRRQGTREREGNFHLSSIAVSCQIRRWL